MYRLMKTCSISILIILLEIHQPCSCSPMSRTQTPKPTSDSPEQIATKHSFQKFANHLPNDNSSPSSTKNSDSTENITSSQFSTPIYHSLSYLSNLFKETFFKQPSRKIGKKANVPKKGKMVKEKVQPQANFLFKKASRNREDTSAATSTLIPSSSALKTEAGSS